MLKLLVEQCLDRHNTFIEAARNARAPEGVDRAPMVPLNLVRQVDMIEFDPVDFADAVRENAMQSLQYAHGSEVSFDYEAIEDWVYRNVVGSVPVIPTTMGTFPFVGEGVAVHGLLGGVEQEEIGLELRASILDQDLPSLQQRQLAFDRLQECIGLLEILGAMSPDQAFGNFCVETLQLSDEEMAAFGGPASALRTAVQLCHVASLYHLLEHSVADPTESLDPLYQAPMSEKQVATLRATLLRIEGVGPGTVAAMYDGIRVLVYQQYKDFSQPTPADCVLNSQGMYFGIFDFCVYGDSELGSQDWFSELFPADLTAANIKGVYEEIGHFVKDQGR